MGQICHTLRVHQAVKNPEFDGGDLEAPPLSDGEDVFKVLTEIQDYSIDDGTMNRTSTDWLAYLQRFATDFVERSVIADISDAELDDTSKFERSLDATSFATVEYSLSRTYLPKTAEIINVGSSAGRSV